MPLQTLAQDESVSLCETVKGTAGKCLTVRRQVIFFTDGTEGLKEANG